MDWKDIGLAAGGGIGAGLLGSLLGGGGAGEQLDKIPDVLKQYMGPYAEAGQRELDPYSKELHGLISDPGALMQKLSEGYTPSAGYQFQKGEALKAAKDAAGSQGMFGTPSAQAHAEGIASGLANQDFNQYLSHALGLFGTGLSGQQGLIGQGQQAASGMGQDIAQSLMSKAGLAQQQQNQEMSMFGDILGAGAKALPFL
jgi:hypothetical protein